MSAREMSPHGAALLAHYRGEPEQPLIIRRDDGLEGPLPMAHAFRSPDQFSPTERAALELCRGRVLDVGGGSGVHSLVLQERGIAVTAIDIDAQAVEVMRGRGVADARRADIWTLAGESFDTILMLGHGIGMAGDIAGLARFLAHARGLVARGGQMLLESCDPAATQEPGHLAYHEANRRAGRYIGETRICLVHGDEVGPIFPWLLVDPDTLAGEAAGAGWTCEVVCRVPSGEYVARLVP
jgi:SAM-dependent methyltransferase